MGERVSRPRPPRDEGAGVSGGFVIIGENIHTTRIVRRPSPRLVESEDVGPSIAFVDEHGEPRLLPIPEEEQRTQEFAEGRVKHVRSAVRLARAGEQTGVDYLRRMALEQIEADAAFLDVNVDEYSHRLPEQIETMQFLVGLLGQISSVPLSIDSSNGEIIEAGIAAASGHLSGPPMLNSASLERIDALDLAKRTGGPVIVTASGASGMPSNAAERVENAGHMIDAAVAKEIPLDRIYVDPLVFPISVDGDFGHHVLDAIRAIRAKYGSEIHITGGMSNVSFGLPSRRLINDVFLALAVEAGADSGIIDPLQNDVRAVMTTDRTSKPFQLALAVLDGTDRHCREYMRAWRAGELEHAPSPPVSGPTA
jgi:cobalamin-dependent methionine synthase I